MQFVLSLIKSAECACLVTHCLVTHYALPQCVTRHAHSARRYKLHALTSDANFSRIAQAILAVKTHNAHAWWCIMTNGFARFADVRTRVKCAIFCASNEQMSQWIMIWNICECNIMGIVHFHPVTGVSDLVPHKPGCTITKDGKRYSDQVRHIPGCTITEDG